MSNDKPSNGPTWPVPLAIVGIAARFPKAENHRAYWSNIVNRVDCITDVPETHWSPDDYYSSDPKAPDMTYARRGGFLDPVAFNPLEYGIPPTSMEATDTSQLLGMVVAKEALRDAGYGDEGRPFDRDRTSVILGVTGTLEQVVPLGARLGHPVWRKSMAEAGLPEDVIEDVVARISDSYVPWKEASFPGLLGNVVAGRIANHLDLGGTNCVVDAACASALSAINLAALELAAGRADMALTGGIDTFNDIFMYMCFSKTPALSPTGDSRPFSMNGDGTILGEGLGLLVLKRLDDARRDGDKVYAVIKGMGTSSDGKGHAIYAPSSEGQVKCLERAFQSAGVRPKTIELIEAHGTGTRVGDGAEATGLGEVFNRDRDDDASWCALGSVKSQIGHTKAAAGAAGLIKAALALHHKVLPPTIKIDQPHEVIAPGKTALYVNTEKRPWLQRAEHPRRAGISSFGFGGSNFHFVLEEASSESEGPTWNGEVLIFAFSADSREVLADQIKAFPTNDSETGPRTLAARLLAEFDVTKEHRLLLLWEKDRSDLAKLMGSAAAMLAKYAGQQSWRSPDGIFYGSGKPEGKLGVLFPGQGSQYVGMFRDLSCVFPQMRQVLNDVNLAFEKTGELSRGRRLTDMIFPLPSFDQKSRKAHDLALRATEIAQPAIGAVSIGALKVLNYFGFQPEAAAGHSYGELTALCSSDRFDIKAFYLLSKLRGRLMAAGEEGERGGMLAVRASIEDVEAIIAEESLDLIVANKNAPTQAVLSGSRAAVEHAETVFARRKVTSKKLPVAAAFHSNYVADAEEPFRRELEKVQFKAGSIPVFSNTTAEVYPEDLQDARNLLATQLTRPVEFVREIHNMYDSGVRTFVEVGPGARLTGLVKSILSDVSFNAVAVDNSSGKHSGLYDLAGVLAQLSAVGHAVELTLWDDHQNVMAASQRERKKPGMTIPVTGANFKSKAEARPKRSPLHLVDGSSNSPITSSQRMDAPSKPVAPVAEVKPRIEPAPRASVPAGEARSNGTPVSTPILGDALRQAQESMAVLQKMQTETAELHRRFLEGQDAAQQTIRTLIEQQRMLLTTGSIPSTNVAPVQALEPTPFVRRSNPINAVPAATRPAAEATTAMAPLPVKAAPPKAAAPVDRGLDQNKTIEVLRRVVAEKTGYPEEMLELDMSLDADLGIDSIKRVEILSGMKEALPETPDIAPDQMGAIQTLRDIVAQLGAVGGPVAPVESSSSSDSIAAETLLQIVAEKTGYPQEMLGFEMSLDADLGIDSIKRVEILSALQEALPNAAAVKPEDMGSLGTLGDIVAYLGGSSDVGVAVENSGADQETLHRILMSVVAEKTGYPSEMLGLEMSLDADLGIDSIKRVEILSALQDAAPGIPSVAPDQMGGLQTLGDIVRLLSGPVVSEANADVDTGSGAGVKCADLTGLLFGVVAEKTGYPPEMLNLEMSLDADLGIDSIKRVEILSALQDAAPELPAVEPDVAGKLQTLGDIVDFLGGPSSETPAAQIETGRTAIDGVSVAGELLAAVAEKTGYPAEMLSMEMSLEADLGIDSIKRVEILSALQEKVPGLPEVQPGDLGRIQTLQDIVNLLSTSATVEPVAVVPSVEAKPAVAAKQRLSGDSLIRRVLEVAPLNRDLPRIEGLAEGGVLWLACPDDALRPELERALASVGAWRVEVVDSAKAAFLAVPDDLTGLVIAAGLDADDLFLENSFKLVRLVGPVLAAKQEGALLATVSRLDGAFGLAASTGELNPVSGGLAGLLKTAAREWTSLHCHAFDLGGHVSLALAADALAGALLCDGPVELGLQNGALYEPILRDETVGELGEANLLSKGDPVLVSGGGRGVTAEIAIALAETWQPTLVILGRTPLKEGAEPDWLAGLTDEAAIKKALMTHSDKKLKPRELQDRYRGVMSDRELRRNLDRMQQAGSRVVYHDTDIRDREKVAALVDQIRRAFGPIKGIVHGAGVLADRAIVDKTDEQFRRVYGTKVDGLRALLDAVEKDPLAVMVYFSSSTGRFGRQGQVDYAVANEVLNKTAQQQARLRPDCRVVSVNWGPWNGGMVDASLKKIFLQEGIGVIELAAGADYLMREIGAAAKPPVEVVILGPLDAGPTPGHSDDANQGRTIPTAKKSVGKVEATATAEVEKPALKDLKLAFERPVSPKDHPFLYSHVLDGKAVLPTVIMMEWFAHGALHKHLGKKFLGIESLRILKGVIFEDELPYTVRVLTGKAEKAEDGRLLVPMELQGENGTRHASAKVLLGNQTPASPKAMPRLEHKAYRAERGPYEILFHGAHFQGIEQVEGCDAKGAEALVKAGPPQAEWLDSPLRKQWLTDPLAIDCAFQLMVLWSVQQTGNCSLPVFVDTYRQYRAFPDGSVQVSARVIASTAHSARVDIDFLDSSGELIAQMKGYECVIDASLERAFANNALLQAVTGG